MSAVKYKVARDIGITYTKELEGLYWFTSYKSELIQISLVQKFVF